MLLQSTVLGLPDLRDRGPLKGNKMLSTVSLELEHLLKVTVNQSFYML
jgi:hypothetical protein